MELLIQNQSVGLNIVGDRECLPLPKENQKLREHDENQGTGRYWKTQTKNVGRIQEYEKFVFGKLEASKMSFYSVLNTVLVNKLTKTRRVKYRIGL